jgi:Glycosyl hydrolase family 76
MGVNHRRILAVAALCFGLVYFLVTGSESLRARSVGRDAGPSFAAASRFATAAALGIDELLGDGGHSVVAWDRRTGLWGGHTKPNWWQSALAITTLVRYAERTDSTARIYQTVLMRTYRHNIFKPYSTARRDFANEFMDDTGWWGLAWLQASQYELRYRHDRTAAARFLAVAEWDANYIASEPKRCGGIVWALRRPPDTITSAEFLALSASLASYRSDPGVFHDPAKAAVWLADARGALAWLRKTRLVNIHAGHVYNGLRADCAGVIGGSITYSEGEVADGLVALGTALHDRTYYSEAARFLRYAIGPRSGLVEGGVLEEHCVNEDGGCERLKYKLDIPAYKGVFVQAVSDWSAATGSDAFRAFLRRQATAVIQNAIAPGRGGCTAGHSCQFGFGWSSLDPASARIWVTLGSQESAIDALTAVLPRYRSARTPRRVGSAPRRSARL